MRKEDEVEFELEVEKALREMQQHMQASIAERTRHEVTPGLDLLSQLESHLTVTERTWSRLPPLASNRQGWKAQVELWFKRQIKRATWWYVWEQVNFNAATNDALRTMTLALAEQKKRELELRVRLDELQASLQSLRAERQGGGAGSPEAETQAAATRAGKEMPDVETGLF
ncbi:MAG TPA: hypothetical protein VD835_19800 [Pyrinomonadaceae bacterium]|nr:hypothetical protein [Pyrinomonadaceae bacterium]